MTADPEIPEAAVEAAARALDPQVFDYTALNVHKRSAFQSLARLRARAALAAAAPEIARAARIEALQEVADAFRANPEGTAEWLRTPTAEETQ